MNGTQRSVGQAPGWGSSVFPLLGGWLKCCCYGLGVSCPPSAFLAPSPLKWLRKASSTSPKTSPPPLTLAGTLPAGADWLCLGLIFEGTSSWPGPAEPHATQASGPRAAPSCSPHL